MSAGECGARATVERASSAVDAAASPGQRSSLGINARGPVISFFVPGINQLNVFIDDSMFVILTISGAPDAPAKATAVGLGRDIEK